MSVTTKEMIWKDEVDSIQMYWKDEVDAKQKMGIMKYVNSKLESMLGINIGPTYKGSLSYIIEPKFEVEIKE